MTGVEWYMSAWVGAMSTVLNGNPITLCCNSTRESSGKVLRSSTPKGLVCICVVLGLLQLPLCTGGDPFQTGIGYHSIGY